MLHPIRSTKRASGGRVLLQKLRRGQPTKRALNYGALEHHTSSVVVSQAHNTRVGNVFVEQTNCRVVDRDRKVIDVVICHSVFWC